MEKNNFEKYIDLFKPVMKAMHSLLGEKSEFILHDLSTTQSSVAVVVGNITNRPIGAPSTNLVIDALKKYGDKAEDMLNYASYTKDGRQLKSSTIFIRENDKIVGCLCYNVDLTEFKTFGKILDNFCQINTGDEKEQKPEVFAQEVSDVVEDIIQYEIEKADKPVPHMSRGDKLSLVATLEAKGVFDVKGSAETVARFLGVSVFTIYNYIKDVRSGLNN
ncbi:helix-turn-helix transcriptional regulator [Clostridium polynesiense]|uniref:helix-turn-helix transcriptional regulator n=1 Tax=Clostridium polynesiense TaxID=1325933 RepID=UPI000693331F|nr:PAS domain-containing protein [Clostridium polynesiense]